MKTLKNMLHEMAIIHGWYKVITKGLPLNVCKTTFGVYCFEGYYTPEPLGTIIKAVYEWDQRDTFDDELDWERRTNL